MKEWMNTCTYVKTLHKCKFGFKACNRNIKGEATPVCNKKNNLEVPIWLSFQGLTLFLCSKKLAKYS